MVKAINPTRIGRGLDSKGTVSIRIQSERWYSAEGVEHSQPWTCRENLCRDILYGCWWYPGQILKSYTMYSWCFFWNLNSSSCRITRNIRLIQTYNSEFLTDLFDGENTANKSCNPPKPCPKKETTSIVYTCSNMRQEILNSFKG